MSGHGKPPFTPQHFAPNEPLKHAKELHETALAIGARGKGLLAADESTGSIKKRLAQVGKENTEDNRREWRDILFTAPANIEEHISGIITFEETLMKHEVQLDSKYTGQSFVDVIKARGTIPGIKVDKGTVGLPRTSPEEPTTRTRWLARKMPRVLRARHTFQQVSLHIPRFTEHTVAIGN